MFKLLRIGSFLSAALCFAIFTGCTTVPDPGVKPPSTPGIQNSADINQALLLIAAQSSHSASNYQIGPEDQLQITLYNIPESEARVTPRLVTLRVNQSGAIVLPLVGEIIVKGMTVSTLEQSLRARFDRYIHNPQIGVQVTEFRQRVSVIGAVQKPGMVELTGPKTLVDILAMAGGLTERASNQVHIYRNTPEGRQNFVIDLAFLTSGMRPPGDETEKLLNMPIQVGDVLNVPQAGSVFIDGAVKTPGAFPLPRRSTLRQTLMLAGGVDFELANYSGTTIFRRRPGGEVDTFQVDLEEINAGKAADPIIEPDDTIVVPISTAKYFIKRYVGIIISGNISPFMFR